MQKYICLVCGYIYDEALGVTNIIPENTLWNELPDQWICPECSSDQDNFEVVEF